MTFAASRRLTPRRVRFKRAPFANALLTIDELGSGNWQVRGERAMRSGAAATDSAASGRAYTAGLVMVGRTFFDRDTDRGLWVQLSPWVTADDAHERFGSGEDELHANLAAGGVTFTAEPAEAHDIPGADEVRALTYRLPKRKKETTMLVLVWRTDNWIGTVGANTFEAAWSWTEVADLAATQITRMAAKGPSE